MLWMDKCKKKAELQLFSDHPYPKDRVRWFLKHFETYVWLRSHKIHTMSNTVSEPASGLLIIHSKLCAGIFSALSGKGTTSMKACSRFAVDQCFYCSVAFLMHDKFWMFPQSLRAAWRHNSKLCSKIICLPMIWLKWFGAIKRFRCFWAWMTK